MLRQKQEKAEKGATGIGGEGPIPGRSARSRYPANILALESHEPRAL